MAEFEAHDRLDGLPPDAAALLARGGTGGFFSSAAWYGTLIAHALPPGAMPRFVLCRAAGAPAALVPMQKGAGRALQSLTGPYTCLYAPHLPAAPDRDALRGAGVALGRFCRAAALARIEALPAEWPGLDAFAGGLAASGLAVRRYAHFGNWHERVGGRSFGAYLAGRPGALRETVRRRLRRRDRDTSLNLSVIRGGDALEPDIAAFEAVYARSWKQAEPFPRLNAAVMRAAAVQGTLRLGVLRRDGRPIAAQYWVVEHGHATVLKLAHDEAARALSPGTLLTAAMIERLLDEERAEEIDFGRGDDPYKRLWTGARRQRVGLMLADPLSAPGLAALGRHALGRVRRAAAAWS